MSEETRTRIIQAGAELIHKQGFNNTGLKDILQAAGVPKGSFYFYFANKEAFGIEVVDYYGSLFLSLADPILSDTTQPALKRLRLLFDTFRDHFESEGFSRGCPIGNLSQEMSDLSPAFRARLERALNGLDALIHRVLEEAHNNGELPTGLDAAETARFIISAWHGAIIRMKVAKNGDALDLFSKFVFESLLK